MALIGLSGSGKTSFFKALLKQLPYTGKIELQSHSLSKVKKKELFQDESGFERIINNNEFIKKVKINNILKETTGKFDFHLILNNLTSKIEEVSNDLAK